jgi:formylmethanofuran dehydrogenase subunit E
MNNINFLPSRAGDTFECARCGAMMPSPQYRIKGTNYYVCFVCAKGNEADQ